MPTPRLRLRHDTAANWTSRNPVLLAGEVGVETDTNKVKVGNGTTAWNSLPYLAGEGGGGGASNLDGGTPSTTYGGTTAIDGGTP